MITFGKQEALNRAQEQRALINSNLSTPFFTITEPGIDLDDEHVASLSIEDIKHITSLQYEISPEEIKAVPEQYILFAINTICSTATTLE